MKNRGRKHLVSRLLTGSWVLWTSCWWKKMTGCRSKSRSLCMRMATWNNKSILWVVYLLYKPGNPWRFQFFFSTWANWSSLINRTQINHVGFHLTLISFFLSLNHFCWSFARAAFNLFCLILSFHEEIPVTLSFIICFFGSMKLKMIIVAG